MNETEQERQMQFPRKEFEHVCDHSLGLIDQNREYLQMRLASLGDQRTEEALTDIEIETARMRRTVNELMNLLEFPVELPKAEARPLVWFDLCQLLRAVEGMQEDVFRQVKVNLTLELSGLDACWLRADPEQTEQLCFHLLSNALRACAPGGRVVFRLERKDEGYRLTVLDDGCGLPTPEHWRENHRRFLGSAKAGLLLCRAYCRRFGWTLTLSDRREGGARAEVQMPFPGEKPELTGEVELNSSSHEKFVYLRWLIRRELRLLGTLE